MDLNTKLQSILAPDFQEFIRQNEHVDVHKLILSASPENIDIRDAAEQIWSRKKAQGKLPSWIGTPGLVFPPPLSIEQSSSEKAAAYKTTILTGTHLVDLTGGMGVDLLAISQGYQKATHVEMDPWLSEIFANNSARFGYKIETFNGRAEDFLEKFEGKATFFIDPARRDDTKKKVFLFEDCSPNMVSLLPLLNQKADKVLVKAAPMIDISLGISQLLHVAEVHVVSVNNECKEVLFLLDFERDIPEIPIKCVDLKETEKQSFDFTFNEEKNTEVLFSDAQDFLYEPNASIRKAGAFKSIAKRYNLTKIAINTHLYTSEELITNFPGRVFKIQDEIDKKNLKTSFPNGKANVISKNHPLTADQLKKKLGLKDGGEEFLVGFRDQKNKTRLFKAVRPSVNTFQT